MKYCKDCRFFRGNLTDDEVDFLESMLRRYDARLMLNSWVKLGQVKIPSGRKLDFEKAEAVRILKRTLALCAKEHVYVYAVDSACSLFEPKRLGKNG